MSETPTPRITCRAEGHVAICPDCGEEIEVPVADVPFLDGQGIQHGHTTEHDLTVFEAHWQAHGA